MVTYKKVKRKYDIGYSKDGAFVKGDRVPQEVKDKMEYADVIPYDDQPERRRCLFCDAPQARIRVFNPGDGPIMIDLCEYHYFEKNLGQIAQEVREQAKALIPKVVKKKRRKAKLIVESS